MTGILVSLGGGVLAAAVLSLLWRLAVGREKKAALERNAAKVELAALQERHAELAKKFIAAEVKNTDEHIRLTKDAERLAKDLEDCRKKEIDRPAEDQAGEIGNLFPAPKPEKKP